MSDQDTPRSVTLEHVAEAAGVSRATVSRVINATRNVDPQLQEIVQRAIDATGYVPNRAARSLVTKRTGSVALVVSAAADHTFDDPFLGRVFTDPFFGRVVSGVLSVLRPLGTHLVLMVVDTDAARTQLIGSLRHGDIDGVVLTSVQPDDPLPRMLTDAKLPVVLFGRPAQSIPISYVDVAAHTGAALAAKHLIARGCKKIATISGPVDGPPGHDRLAGFREAMARHGFAFVPHVEGSFTQEGGEKAMEQLLADNPELDGLFVANDLMALGALLVLRDHGKTVPGDVAVVGFDDSSAATAARPPLTTVRQPLEDMAAEMARLLLGQIDRSEQRVRSVIFEPTLVVRRSA